MNDNSEATESARKHPGKTYHRELDEGVRLEADVSPCVFRYARYPLQVEVKLQHHGEHLGVAFAVDRAQVAETYTDADVERLLAGVRIAPCHRCAAPAFDPESVDTNRDGLCETCFMEGLQASISRAEEADRRAIADRDRRMKREGKKVRVSAWVHPEGGGDDYPVDWYLDDHPEPDQVKGWLRERHSSRLDDYEIVVL